MDALDLPLANRLAALLGPQAARPQLLDLAAHLALRGPLRVIDGGNQFNALIVARSLRRGTAELPDALRRIRLTRGFTCYQVLALLAEPPPGPPVPVLVFDLLATFYDENVSLPESRRLLAQALTGLHCLAAAAPVVVGVRPPNSLVSARAVLLEAVLDSSAAVWTLYDGAPPPAAAQLPLWPAG
jgi:hypothetical protein